MTEIRCVGVLAHPMRPKSFTIAHRINQSLQQRGLETFLYTDWQEDVVRHDVARADAIVAIGGDGAMLRAARVCGMLGGVPVLGINMGQLGFLTEIPHPDTWEDYLDKLLAGEYWIETRTMIRTAVLAEDDTVTAEGEALNDVVISSSKFGRMVRLETFIDGDWTTTYSADALVIATATGSTAYALSCGGPILPPELNNILIVPAAPHLSMERPIVLSKGAQVEVTSSSNNRNDIIVSTDGSELGGLSSQGRVRLWVSDHTAQFIRLRGRNYFYRSLLDRLEPRYQRASEEQ